MVIFGSLSGVYIIPTIYEDYLNLEHAARNKGSLASDKASLGNSNLPEQMANVDEFARNAVSAVYLKAKELKAKELKANSSVVRFFVFFCDAELMKVYSSLWCYYQYRRFCLNVSLLCILQTWLVSPNTLRNFWALLEPVIYRPGQVPNSQNFVEYVFNLLFSLTWSIVHSMWNEGCPKPAVRVTVGSVLVSF